MNSKIVGKSIHRQLMGIFGLVFVLENMYRKVVFQAFARKISLVKLVGIGVYDSDSP